MERKYVSPLVTFFMGLFMLAVAVIYTLVMSEYLDLSSMDSIVRLWFGIPSIFLSMGGATGMIYAIIMLNTLKFDGDSGEWVMRQDH